MCRETRTIMGRFMSNILNFILEYKDAIPTVITTLGAVFGLFKAIFTFDQASAIKRLELLKKYFSKDEINKLDKEPKFIQSLTCNVFPYFRNTPYKTVKILINADIDNFIIFFNLYKKQLVDEKTKITEKGKKKLRYRSLKKWVFRILFIFWLSLMLYILSSFFPLPLSLPGWFILIIGVGIPEVLLLNNEDIVRNLEKFNK